MKINLLDLRNNVYYVLKDSVVDELFDNDGSLEFREFIKYLDWYIKDSSVINNYYHAVLICDGINKYANNKFWEKMRHYK